MKIKLFILGLTLSITNVIAHGDDDHGASKAMKAKPTEQGKKFGVRAVWDVDQFLFYPLDANSKAITTGAKLSGTYELLPEGKGKPQALLLTSKGEYFSAPIDFKGAYRAKIRIKIEQKVGNEVVSENLKEFSLDPQQD